MKVFYQGKSVEEASRLYVREKVKIPKLLLAVLFFKGPGEKPQNDSYSVNFITGINKYEKFKIV